MMYPSRFIRILMLALSFITLNVAVFSQSKFLSSFLLLNSQSTVSSLPPSNSISHIVIEDSTLWIGTSKGIARSTNTGRTWESFRSNPAFANDGIFAIATSTDTVWVATGYDKAISDGTVQTGSGYAYSIDAGSTWQHLNQALDQRGDSIISYGINDSLWLLPVVVPEQNVTFDISLTPGTVWIASWASGLRKSTNNGTSWQRIILPTDSRSSLQPTDTLWTFAVSDTSKQHRIYPHLDPRYNNNFLAFAVHAVDNDTIWCGTAGGVNKSTDGGISWRKFSHQNQASPILGNWVIAIDEQRFQGKRRIWTTNWRASDPDEQFGVSYTDDGGQTWKNLLHGIKAYDFAFKDSIAYIAADDGIYRTPDGGFTFMKIGAFTDLPNHEAILPSQISSVFSVDIIRDTVVIGTGDGLLTTIDNATHSFGSSWKIYRTHESAQSTTYAYPNPFSPSIQPLRIHYSVDDVSNATHTVSIEIFDEGMNRIRTLINNAPRAASPEFDEIWDGRTDNGKYPVNGLYFYRVVIDTRDPLFGKILLLQ